MEQALSDMRVLDLTHHIAGPYCTKLLGDYGADVIKVERPGEGDSARRLGPFLGDIPHPEKSGLFLHLNTNKRSVTLDLKSDVGRETFVELAKAADVVVENFRPGVMASLGLDYETLKKANPLLVMASISNFGQSGPYRDFKSSELVLSAMGGGMPTGLAEREPLKYAGWVRQFQTGLLAVNGILAAFHTARQQGIGQYLDLSMFEMHISNMDYRAAALVRFQFTGENTWRQSLASRPADMPAGIYPCADGYVYWFAVPRWANVCRMIGRPDLVTDPRFADPGARVQNGTEFDGIFLEWSLQRTKKQCWEEGIAAGLICGPCNNVEELWQEPHVRGRGFWTEVDHPAMGKVTIPGRPFVMSETPWRVGRPAPLLGQHNPDAIGAPDGVWRHHRPAEAAREVHGRRKAVRYPLEGVRVLDLCQLFAGNFANHILGDLGAQVIKVESTQYWQFMVRGTFARLTKELMQKTGSGWGYWQNDPGDRPWDRYGAFNAHCRNKLSFTVDMRKPEGVDIFKRLVKVSDIFIEGNSPTTVERLGLDYPQLKEVNPGLIMVRMPGFGTSGPYRSYAATAQVLEAFCGHTMLLGYRDTDVTSSNMTIASDAAAGAGAATAALMALHYRTQTGKGQLIEMAQVENFMPFIGDALMDYILNKRVRSPLGNRHATAAPCDLFPCAGVYQWVAITVHNEEEWQGLRRALGDPEWTRNPRFATPGGRSQDQDDMWQHIAEWTRTRDKYDIMHRLQKEGVPCGPLLDDAETFKDPHLLARGHFTEVDVPHLGTYLAPGMIWRMSETPLKIRYPAPTLGEHNEYVYKELLGYSDEECHRLEREGQIGTEPGPHIP